MRASKSAFIIIFLMFTLSAIAQKESIVGTWHSLTTDECCGEYEGYTFYKNGNFKRLCQAKTPPAFYQKKYKLKKRNGLFIIEILSYYPKNDTIQEQQFGAIKFVDKNQIKIVLLPEGEKLDKIELKGKAMVYKRVE